MTKLHYDLDHETDEEILTGASIDLETLHDDMGYIPHPRGLCENPAPQQELWISLTKNLEDKSNLRIIPSILEWHGTNIGYYDDDGDFISVVEDEDECDPERDRFYVFWG